MDDSVGLLKPMCVSVDMGCNENRAIVKNSPMVTVATLHCYRQFSVMEEAYCS